MVGGLRSVTERGQQSATHEHHQTSALLDNSVVAARRFLPVVLSNLPGTVGDGVARDALHLAHIGQVRLLVVAPPGALKIASHGAAGFPCVVDGVPDVDRDV